MKKTADHIRSRFRRTLVNGFIIFHLLALGFWGMPESPLNSRVSRLFEPYIQKVGLWHAWDMFAPMPLSTNFHCQALVTMKDGSTTIWQFPRMEELGLVSKIPGERYRKWMERVRQDSYSIVWHDTSVFIARQCFKDPANPPVKVALTRLWCDVPQPAPGDYQPMPAKFDYPNQYKFHECEILPEDLE